MKKYGAIAASLLMILTAAGCAGGTGAAEASVAETPERNEAAPLNSDQELSGEITVSVFEPMPQKLFLEEAAAKFQALYPNTKINVKAYADIIGIDVLPWYRYATGGQFEDLTAYMEQDPDFQMSDYRENIIDAMKLDGKQYVLPLDYSFNLMAYDPDLFTEEQLNTLKAADTMTTEEMAALVADGFDGNGGDTTMFATLGGNLLLRGRCWNRDTRIFSISRKNKPRSIRANLRNC
ncbi:MAG: extracellular solute-binding protein [Clostridiales bacterium]|jgi:ABC-type glycerol-3-phosphate transport system substrate-binding protein|nr:extracellular solute-binding protein [Clostridiales bacterium]